MGSPRKIKAETLKTKQAGDVGLSGLLIRILY